MVHAQGMNLRIVSIAAASVMVFGSSTAQEATKGVKEPAQFKALKLNYEIKKERALRAVTASTSSS